MNLYLKGYSHGYRMLIVARTEETYSLLMQRGVEIMHITDSTIVIQPGEIVYPTSCVSSERLNLLSDFDIVEINEKGVLYRSYSYEEREATVFLGAKCNSNCVMCPASDMERKRGFSYDRDNLLKYIAYLPCNLNHIVMTGGEPTLQPSLFLEALSKIKEKYPDAKVLLLSNGRSLSDKKFYEEVCRDRPNNFRVAIPIHGDNPELHDSITRAEGSFNQTILALHRLMNSEVEVEIRIVVTKLNCDNLTGIADLIISNFPKVSCVNFIGLEPRGNCALNFDSVYIDSRNSFLKSKPAIYRLIKSGYDVGLYNYPLCAVDKDCWSLAAKSISGYKTVYHKDCYRCDVKDMCGGFFDSAMSIAHPVAHPIVSEKCE